MKIPNILYGRRHFPLVIIQQGVWLYHRFGLSLFDIENLLGERRDGLISLDPSLVHEVWT